MIDGDDYTNSPHIISSFDSTTGVMTLLGDDYTVAGEHMFMIYANAQIGKSIN